MHLFLHFTSLSKICGPATPALTPAAISHAVCPAPLPAATAELLFVPQEPGEKPPSLREGFPSSLTERIHFFFLCFYCFVVVVAVVWYGNIFWGHPPLCQVLQLPASVFPPFQAFNSGLAQCGVSGAWYIARAEEMLGE